MMFTISLWPSALTLLSSVVDLCCTAAVANISVFKATESISLKDRRFIAGEQNLGVLELHRDFFQRFMGWKKQVQGM